jgi:hypothetical protein
MADASVESVPDAATDGPLPDAAGEFPDASGWQDRPSEGAANEALDSSLPPDLGPDTTTSVAAPEAGPSVRPDLGQAGGGAGDAGCSCQVVGFGRVRPGQAAAGLVLSLLAAFTWYRRRGRCHLHLN